MRILVIAPQPFFSPRGTPFSVYYRTLITAELGAQINLLTYGEGSDVDIPGVRIIRIPRFKWLGNVRTGPSLLKLFLDIFIISRAFVLMARHRYDVVHAHEEAVFFCRWLKPLFGFKLVYDMHSSLPQQLTNFNFTNSKIIRKIFESLENSSLRAANAVITICPDLEDYALGVLGDTDKHFLIENSIFEPVRLKNQNNRSAKDSESNPVETNTIERLIHGDHLFVYAGTLEYYQGIDIIVQAMPTVLDRLPDARVVIVGGAPDQVLNYRKMAENEGVDGECFFTGRLDQKSANIFIDAATVLLSPRIAGTNTPLKIYQQLASGKPLVATNIYSHTQVLSDSVAFLVNPDSKGMASGMIMALADRADARRRAENAQHLYAEKYSRDSYVNKMRALLEHLS